MYGYTEAGPVRRRVRLLVTSRPVAWLSARFLVPVDRLVDRASGGRPTLSRWVSGLPVVQLTTTGARSGELRTTPVMAIPDGDGLVVVAANFGSDRNPAWYHNLRANPQVEVAFAGRTTAYAARELEGEEAQAMFAEALRLNPGWLRFRDRAGGRRLPVVRLGPTGQAPGVEPPATS